MFGFITFKRGLIPAFKRDKRGVTAIEFAMIAPLFFYFIFAIIELSFFNYLRASVEFQTHDVARLAMTGGKYTAAPNETRDAYFERILKEQLKKGVFTTVQTTIKKDIYQNIKGFHDGKTVANPTGGFGKTNQIVQLTVSANYQFFTPLLGMLANNINAFAFTTTVFIKNEYF